MTAPDAMNVSAFLKTLRSFPLRWLLPALLIGGGACLYALHAPPVWEASQALMVRNEVTGTPDGLGKFGSIDAMKTVQETILELLKSRRVLEDAMVQAGVSPQPSAEQIDNFATTSSWFLPREPNSAEPRCFTSKFASTNRSGRWQ